MTPKRLSNLLLFLLIALLTISAVPADRLKAHVDWLRDPAREGRRSVGPGAAA